MKLKLLIKNLLIVFCIFLTFVLTVVAALFSLFLFYNYIFHKSLTNSSSINQILQLDIINLITNIFISGILLLGFFMLLNSTLNLALKVFGKELSNDFFIFEIKAYLVLISFSTMLFNLNSEQFNIVATILSIWAISSSSKFTKQIIKKLSEIVITSSQNHSWNCSKKNT